MIMRRRRRIIVLIIIHVAVTGVVPVAVAATAAVVVILDSLVHTFCRNMNIYARIIIKTVGIVSTPQPDSTSHKTFKNSYATPHSTFWWHV